ncbi:outer membrane beta-barrel protein [Aminobacter sp. BE322]|uniref:outer membrane protein n=1 Tax=unclassified Aminobacter TaxID=2644704 RepID=UPI003D1B7210
MMLKYRAALALAAMTLWPLAATAADYDPPIVVEEAPEYVPVEVGSGWYLRGDIGYALSTSAGSASYRTFTAPSTYGSASFDSEDLDGEFTFGGGVGYRFTDYFRGDVTVDGFRADFSGTTSSTTPCGGPAGTTCRSEDSAEMSAISIMANAYADLGTYVGFTPYVGAGAGYSYVSWSDLGSTNYCVDGGGAVCPVAPPATDTRGGAKDWRFTYALMAGVAYDLSQNLKVDLGYKYRRIDGGDMFGWNATDSAAGARGIQGKDGGLDQHEIKVGLRYEIW